MVQFVGNYGKAYGAVLGAGENTVGVGLEAAKLAAVSSDTIW